MTLLLATIGTGLMLARCLPILGLLPKRTEDPTTPENGRAKDARPTD